MQQLTTPEQPYLIQSRAIYRCPHCGNPLKSLFVPQNSTSNWLLFTIALLLTPFIIGIIFWIIYLQETKREGITSWWHCESCGYRVATMPAKQKYQIPPAAPRPKRTFNEWLHANKLLVLMLIAVASVSTALIASAIASHPLPSPTPTPSLQKESGNGKQGKARSHKVHSRAGNVDRSEDKQDQSRDETN